MKEGTIQHPKMESFAAIMDIQLDQAVGRLEALFHFTAQFAPRGDIGKFPNKVIAAKSLVPLAESARRTMESARIDESDRFINALIEAKWIEIHAAFRLVVHDWSEHCPEYVRKRLDRSGETFWDGVKPYSTTKVVRKNGPKKSSISAESERSPSGVRADDNGVLPIHTNPIPNQTSIKEPPLIINSPPAVAGTPSVGKKASKGKMRSTSHLDEKNLDMNQDAYPWMQKVAKEAGKRWKYSTDWKVNQGPTRDMFKTIEERSQREGKYFRLWWLEFLETSESNTARYPYAEFLGTFYEDHLKAVIEQHARREMAKRDAGLAQKAQEGMLE